MSMNERWRLSLNNEMADTGDMEPLQKFLRSPGMESEEENEG